MEWGRNGAGLLSSSPGCWGDWPQSEEEAPCLGAGYWLLRPEGVGGGLFPCRGCWPCSSIMVGATCPGGGEGVLDCLGQAGQGRSKGLLLLPMWHAPGPWPMLIPLLTDDGVLVGKVKRDRAIKGNGGEWHEVISGKLLSGLGHEP